MNLVWGFFLYTMLGFALLSIPFLHKDSVGLLDNLFTAASAISTTGLVTVGVYDSYTILGQFVIMVLFQIGGIGYMTLTTYYLLFTTQRITHWHNKLIGAEFTLPRSINVKDFIRSVVVFTIVMETLGAIAFYFEFVRVDMATSEAIWFSIFHSVSAFCTAGFGLFSDSFEAFSDNGLINTTISVLAISGSLGFIVITDLWLRIRKRSTQLSFTTKIVVTSFVCLLSAGTALFYFREPLMDRTGDTLITSFFQAMTAMTTVGFNTVSTGQLGISSLLFVTFLMYLGASPSGTAGGLKITTLTAMIAVLKSRLAGDRRVSFMGRTIPYERLYVATSTFIMYTSIIFIATFLLSFTEAVAFEQILFEVASALGTVGLSTGITVDLTAFGKIVIILLMFVGRIGVLTFGFALLERSSKRTEAYLEDDLAV